MVKTTIENTNGVMVNSEVYIVDGYKPEPLLGNRDAEQLGFIIFNPEGRKLDTEREIRRIPRTIRNSLKVKVDTHPTE